METAALGRAILAEKRADKTGHKPKNVRFVKRGDLGKSSSDVNLFSPVIPIEQVVSCAAIRRFPRLGCPEKLIIDLARLGRIDLHDERATVSGNGL